MVCVVITIETIWDFKIKLGYMIISSVEEPCETFLQLGFFSLFIITGLGLSRLRNIHNLTIHI